MFRASLWYGRLKNLKDTVACVGLSSAIGATVSRLRGDEMGQLRTKRTRHPIHFRHRSTDLEVIKDVLHRHKADVRLSREPKVIIDGGANIGAFSVLMAERYPEATILAVEPDPSNLAVLRQNVQAYPNVRIVEGGVWSKKAHLRVSNPEAAAWALQVEEVPAGTPSAIPAYSVADLLRMSGARVVDLLKLDIEGSEKEVFAVGSAAWLPSVRELLIELHPQMKPNLEDVFWEAVRRRPHVTSRSGEYHHVLFKDEAHELPPAELNSI